MYTEINPKLMTFISSPDFADNSRGFWEYVDRHTDYETFWVVRDPVMAERMRAKGIACGLEGSPEAEEKIRTAAFLLTSSFDWAEPGNRQQIHVTLWHGVGPKKVGFFDSAKGAGSDLDALKIWTTRTDLILATSQLYQLIFGGIFAADPRKIFIGGYPRNDLMFAYDGRKELQKLIGDKAKDSRLIFYLPTMRKGLKAEGDDFSDNIFNYPDYDPAKIDAFLEKENAYMVGKLHFADMDKYAGDAFALPQRLILLDTERMNEQMLTIYHVMNAFDALITDYSSVYADYLLLDRPMIFSLPDLESYGQDRGFVMDDPTQMMPGSVVRTQQELITQLSQAFSAPDREAELRETGRKLFHTYADTHASERLLKELERLASDKQSWKRDGAKVLAHAFLNPESSLSPYTKDLKVEVYVDYGEGLLEKDKRTYEFDTERDANICIQMDLPASAGTLRMDPGDYVHWGLKDLHIYMNGEDLPYGVPNGLNFDSRICFADTDPQVIVMLPPAEQKHVEIRFTAFEQLGEAYRLLQDLQKVSLEKQHQMDVMEADKQRLIAELESARQRIRLARDEVEQMKQTASWKVTKPLRGLKKLKK